MKIFIFTAMFFIFTGTLFSTTIHVPGDYPTIQAGVLASHDGDTVLVADGRYTGYGNRGIDFQGREIVIISENGPENCIIDLQNLLWVSALFVHSGEGMTSVFSGFTIVNGNSVSGAVRIENSGPTIDNCIISECEALAVYLVESAALIKNCIITNCQEGVYPYSGMIPDDVSSILLECTLTEISGDAVHIFTGNIILEKCSIIDCDWAVELTELGSVTATNCTFYNTGGISLSIMPNYRLLLENNIFDGIELSVSGSNCIIDYNCFNNMGNIAINPYLPVGVINSINANGDSCDVYNNIFLDPEFYATTGDSAFHLTENSPCIDAGNPSSPLDPDNTTADIGRCYFDHSLRTVFPSYKEAPSQSILHAPSPNPFNPSTTISFELRDANFVSLRIYDVQGRQVDCLKYGHLSAGRHEFTFDGSGLASGMYFAELEAGDFKQTMKLLLMK